MSAQTIIKLWEMVDTDKVSDADLEALADGETLANELRWLSDVVDGIGCMVSNDGNLKPGTQAGNFQNWDGVTTLLFSIGAAMRTNAESQFVATMANHYLERRMNARLQIRQDGCCK